jgi:hypothetical protein
MLLGIRAGFVNRIPPWQRSFPRRVYLASLLLALEKAEAVYENKLDPGIFSRHALRE